MINGKSVTINGVAFPTGNATLTTIHWHWGDGTTPIAPRVFPAIYGNRVVWTDGRNGTADIYMYEW